MTAQIISSLSNGKIKHLIKLRKDKSYRLLEQKIVTSSSSLIKDLIAYKKFPLAIFASSMQSIPKGLPSSTKQFICNEDILAKASGLCSADTLVAEFDMPTAKTLTKFKRLLVLDKLQDPGNIGNLLRSAQAFNFDWIYFVHGACDPFNDKVVRASQGALFHLNYSIGNEEQLLDTVAKNNGYIYAACASGANILHVEVQHPAALILGNESAGIDKIFSDKAIFISIPMSKNLESLNVAVAGSILMWEIEKALFY